MGRTRKRGPSAPLRPRDDNVGSILVARSDSGRPEIYNNGSLGLIDTGERVIGVTAWHVYEAYLARLALRKLFVCQFGGVTVFPEQILIDKNERLDLATFNLSAVVLDTRRLHDSSPADLAATARSSP